MLLANAHRRLVFRRPASTRSRNRRVAAVSASGPNRTSRLANRRSIVLGGTLLDTPIRFGRTEEQDLNQPNDAPFLIALHAVANLRLRPGTSHKLGAQHASLRPRRIASRIAPSPVDEPSRTRSDRAAPSC